MQTTAIYQNGGLFIPEPNIKSKLHEMQEVKIDFTIMDESKSAALSDKELLGEAIMEEHEAENKRLVKPKLTSNELNVWGKKHGLSSVSLADLINI